MDLDDLELRVSPVPVRVVPLSKRATDAPLEIEGRFAASRAVLIKAPSSGVVDGLRVTLGDAVEAGETICTIGLEMARQRGLATDASIAQLQAQLAEREDLLLAAQQRDEPPPKLAQFENKVRAIEHKLAHERLQKQRHDVMMDTLRVVAPFGGRVSSVSASPGGTIMSGNPLLELVEVDPIVLVLEVPTWVASKLSKGDDVRVRAPSDETLRTGRVARWAPTALDDVRRLLVEVDNADGRIAAGERAVAELSVGERSAWFAPRAALHEEKKGHSLQLVLHGKVLVRNVRVFGGDDREVEVAGSLSSSHLVVLDAERPLKEETEVVIRGDH